MRNGQSSLSQPILVCWIRMNYVILVIALKQVKVTVIKFLFIPRYFIES